MPTTLPNGATIAEDGDLPGALLTAPRQIEFNGLLLGSGTPYRWKELTGWDDMPALDLSDSQRPNEHGDYPGFGLYEARFPSLMIQVRGGTRDITESLLSLLAERLSYDNTEQRLIVSDSAKTLFANARVIARAIPHTPPRSVGVVDVPVQWKCADPLRYAQFYSRDELLSPPQDLGGLTFPLTFPLDYGITIGNSKTAASIGTAPSPVVVTFTGPATEYAVVLSTGEVLGFNLELADGETLVVDTATGTVLLNGTSDRSGWLATGSVPPESWRIRPGAVTVSFVVSGADPSTTRAELQWRDAFW